MCHVTRFRLHKFGACMVGLTGGCSEQGEELRLSQTGFPRSMNGTPRWAVVTEPNLSQKSEVSRPNKSPCVHWRCVGQLCEDVSS